MRTEEEREEGGGRGLTSFRGERKRNGGLGVTWEVRAPRLGFFI